MAPQQNLPIINFTAETQIPRTHAWLSTSHVVRQALEDYGCFVVSTDKIPCDLHDTMFDFAKDLFCLPMETKIKTSSQMLGFGYGKYSSLPLYECFGIENGASLDATQSFTNLLFPSGNNTFCKVTYEYMKLLSEINHCVMKMVFDSYGVDDKQCDSSLLYLARIMKYEAPIHGENPIALPPHSDKSFLGVLDDNGVEGFMIKMRNGEWINHQPSPSTFIVVAGDPLMAWSNGRIYAPLHQVAMKTSAKEVVRYTTGLFSFMTDMIEIPEQLVDDDYYLRFKPFNNMDFLKYVNTEEGKASKCAIESYCGVNTYASTGC